MRTWLASSVRVPALFTALLVLDGEADYARFGLPRRSQDEVLAVVDGGVAVKRKEQAPKQDAKPSSNEPHFVTAPYPLAIPGLTATPAPPPAPIPPSLIPPPPIAPVPAPAPTTIIVAPSASAPLSSSSPKAPAAHRPMAPPVAIVPAPAPKPEPTMEQKLAALAERWKRR
jgi:hypothetical protein